MSRTCQLPGFFEVGPEKPLTIIAGPCQIESEEHCLMLAEKIAQICSEFPVQLIFKSSFDKANRTSLSAQRGVGIDQGLKILDLVKQHYHLPVISDVHNPQQAKLSAEVLDVLQIPAFLCRQTDLLITAGSTGKAVNIKKGQFLAAADLKFAAEKVASEGNHNILLCERGTSFGYRDLIVDYRNFEIMSELNYPVVFDATHSVQKIGGSGGGSSAGSREYVDLLATAAVTTPISAVFLEVHDNPDSAPSDGMNMLNLSQFAALVKKLSGLRNFLQELRT